MTTNEYREIVHRNTKTFKPKDALNAIYNWLENYANNNNMDKAVIGISGGKDSTVVAAILVKVLGKENVFGLLMPNGEQKDIEDSLKVTELLGIDYKIINIEDAYYAMLDMFGEHNNVSNEAKINIVPRIRMTTLYAYGQTHGCRVAGTGNLSERFLGYFTKWGDGASDFNILANFTSLEVMRLGEELGLPLDLVYKTPADGLSGLSDEEKLGVSYVDVHNYIRHQHKYKYDISSGKAEYDKIMRLNDRAKHKLNTNIPTVDYRYCQIKLPELGDLVTITLYNGREEEAFLTATSYYDEGITFETIDCEDIRVSDVKSWKLIED